MSIERAYPNCMKYIQRREGAASGGIFVFDPDGIRLEIFTPTGAYVALRPQRNRPHLRLLPSRLSEPITVGVPVRRPAPPTHE